MACTAELRSRYHPGDPGWTVEQGSALDTDYLDKLGEFDIVYSWGVLHHTGAMWDALANVAPLVAPGGQLFIAIYNDQGQASNRWARVKQRYNRSGPGQRRAILAGVRAYQAAKPLPTLVASQAYHVAHHGRLRRLPKADVAPARGMDRDRDLVDWVGGWPFEVATPEAIFDFYRDRGFTLVHLLTCGGGLGCNEFVFRRDLTPPAPPAGGQTSRTPASPRSMRPISTAFEAVGAQDVEGAVGLVGGHDHDHADAEVEDLGHLAVVDAAEPLDLAEDPRLLPGAALDHGVDVAWGAPGQVAGEATAGDVGDGVHLDRALQRHDRRGVDDRRLQQLVGDGAVGALEGRAVEGPAGDVEAARGGPASSRWSAGRATAGR